MKTTPVHEAMRPHVERFGQRRAAEAAGIAQPNLSRWLKTGTRLSDDAVRQLAEVLGLEIRVRVVRVRRRQGA